MDNEQIVKEINLNLKNQDIGLFESIDFIFGEEFNEMINDLKNGNNKEQKKI